MGRRREARIVAFLIQCFSMQMAENWRREASLDHNMIIERSLPHDRAGKLTTKYTVAHDAVACRNAVIACPQPRKCRDRVHEGGCDAYGERFCIIYARRISLKGKLSAFGLVVKALAVPRSLMARGGRSLVSWGCPLP
jgi:hypothetical protein